MIFQQMGDDNLAVQKIKYKHHWVQNIRNK